MREADIFVKQNLKKARVNVLHKLTRQVLKLEKKRASGEQLKKKERKLERLRQQIDQAKDLDLSDLARTAVVDGPSPNRVEELKGVLTLPLGDDRLRRELILSVAVQNALQVIQDKKDGVVKTDAKGKRALKEEKAKAKAGNNETSARTVVASRDPDLSDGSGDELDEEMLAMNGSASSDSDEDLPPPVDDISDSDGGGGIDMPTSDDEDDGDDDEGGDCNKGNSTSGVFCGFGEGSGSNTSSRVASASNQKPNRRKLKKLQQEGKESQNTAEAKKKSQKQRNRLGQRARQKLWEDQFGRKARHVVENRPANKPRPFKGKKNAKSDGDAAKGKGSRTGAAGGAPSSGKGSKPAEDLSELHPSWAAKKMAKDKTAGIQSFEGKRMTFSDSD